MAALLRLEVLLIAVVEQGIEIGHALDNDIAAPAAVTAAGAAARDVFLASERETPVAAVAGFNGNDYFVDEQHVNPSRTTQRSAVSE